MLDDEAIKGVALAKKHLETALQRYRAGRYETSVEYIRDAKRALSIALKRIDKPEG